VKTITSQLPQAYLQPLRPEVRRPGNLDRHSPPPGTAKEQIIEAEWQSIPPSPARRQVGMAAQAYAKIFSETTLSPQGTIHPRLASARYRQMAPKPDQDRGQLVDTLA